MTIPVLVTTDSPRPAIGSRVAERANGAAPIPRAAILRRARRKAGRIGRYLAMAADYRRAQREGTLPKPVFIVCQNRTGSTFLNRLFGEHPECWAFREGSHQEAMDHEDCPRWLTRQDFVYRWQITKCPLIERWQTPVWLARMAAGYPYGVFKVPHALAKVLAIQQIVPDVQFVLLVRHPAAQIASALAKNNTLSQLRVTADVLTRFLRDERRRVAHLSIVRYEDLVAKPVERFGALCASLGMKAERAMIERCVARVGVRPGRGPERCRVPVEMRQRARGLCDLLDYNHGAME
jgi:hypothetical protein